jgi:Glycosyl transferases group 1
LRLFQNSGLNASYRTRLAQLTAGKSGFAELKRIFLDDRYGASHFLVPVLNGDASAFFANGDDEAMQGAWAREHGVQGKSLEEILLAQIEEHKAEVFYNMDPGRFDGAFVRKLPAHVKRKIAWRAAPGTIDFSGYDLVVSNFPSIRQGYESQGLRTAEFFPAHDPVLDAYAKNQKRDIDVLFFGGYSRHHLNRSKLLETVAELNGKYNVVYHLDRSRYTRLAETPLGLLPPFSVARRPAKVRAISAPPVYGRQMYEQLSRAKIVINMAIDMAGKDRGNMRCFEVMGAGALLLSDEGSYPGGMIDNQTLRLYRSAPDAVNVIGAVLESDEWQQTAAQGHEMVRRRYAKVEQMRKFEGLVQ